MSARETLIETSKPAVGVTLRGEPLLAINKGTSFAHRERKELGLTGRLPSRVNTLDEQVSRAYEQLSSRHDPVRKNTFLQSLKDHNWVLYYALVSKNWKELVPIIYTPTQVRYFGATSFPLHPCPASSSYLEPQANYIRRCDCTLFRRSEWCLSSEDYGGGVLRADCKPIQ